MRRILIQISCLLALALIPALGAAWLHPRAPARGEPPQATGEVSIDDALRQWDSRILWIDARPRALYEQGHIPGAIPLNEDEWDSQLSQVLGKWTPESVVVVYCDSRECQASRHVAERLRKEVGLADVHVLHGGWKAWKESRR